LTGVEENREDHARLRTRANLKPRVILDPPLAFSFDPFTLRDFLPMAPQDLVEAVQRRPFLPFRITLTEGSTYEVRHPELCMVGRRAAIVGVLTPGRSDLLFDRSVTIDLLHIVKLEPVESPRQRRGRH